MYIWIVICGGFFSFISAMGIGANDVANSFATSIGSKALTIKQAVFLACIFETSGAILMGSHVSETIRKGIADYECFQDEPYTLMYGCMWVCFSVALWLFTASYFEMPVSTTHSCIGGMIGMTIAIKGVNCVIWYKSIDTFPYIGGVSGMVISWLISPLLSGSISSLLYVLTRKYILRKKYETKNIFYAFPLLIGITISLNAFFIFYKGAKGIGLHNTPIEIVLSVSLGIGFLSGLIIIPLLYIINKKIEKKNNISLNILENNYDITNTNTNSNTNMKNDRYLISITFNLNNTYTYIYSDNTSVVSHYMLGNPNNLIITNVNITNDCNNINNTNDTNDTNDTNINNINNINDKTKNNNFISKIMDININELDQIDDKDKKIVDIIHNNAEIFDSRIEEFFKYLQIFSASCASFSHGANDVANAIGPFIAIYTIYLEGDVTKNSVMDNNAYWILSFGGIGISIGLLLYGYKIMRAIGIKLCKITPSRGTIIELSAALVTILGTRLSIPLSTTHCQIGATVGVGLLETSWKKNIQGININILYKIIFGWIITCIFVAIITGILTAQGIYSPSLINI